jgi:RNA polymerase sigma-70 factor (ECF subfamily)
MISAASHTMTPVSLQDRSDQELVRLAIDAPEDRHGRAAAAALLARYQGRVYQWCWRYVRNRDDALDLAQEVLLSAYRNLASFGERARFSSWLFAVTRNRCVSAVRRPGLLVDGDAEPELVPAGDPQPDEELVRLEEEERLDELLRAHLTPREQEALCLRCVERMPVDEITRVLSISEASGARAVLQSARRKLRAALSRSRSLDRDEDSR